MMMMKLVMDQDSFSRWEVDTTLHFPVFGMRWWVVLALRLASVSHLLLLMLLNWRLSCLMSAPLVQNKKGMVVAKVEGLGVYLESHLQTNTSQTRVWSWVSSRFSNRKNLDLSLDLDLDLGLDLEGGICWEEADDHRQQRWDDRIVLVDLKAVLPCL